MRPIDLLPFIGILSTAVGGCWWYLRTRETQRGLTSRAVDEQAQMTARLKIQEEQRTKRELIDALYRSSPETDVRALKSSLSDEDRALSETITVPDDLNSGHPDEVREGLTIVKQRDPKLKRT